MVAFNLIEKTDGAHASTLDFTKAVEMPKGMSVDFTKEFPMCKNVRIELYWESPLDSPYEYDGDASLVLLDRHGKALQGLVNQSNPNSTRGLVWYKNLKVNGVTHSGDVRNSNGDPSMPEETILVHLDRVYQEAQKLVTVASTYPLPRQSDAVPFNKLHNCKMLVIDDDTREVLLGTNLQSDYGSFTSVEVAGFSRSATGGWDFQTLCQGCGSQPIALQDIAVKYQLG